MKTLLSVVAAVAGLVLAGPGALAAEKAAPAKAPEKATVKAPDKTPAKVESIGSATMKADGTIVLMLRATGGGAVGDAMVSYPKTHAEYAKILEHLGGLKPGETKPVPPFP